MAASTTAAPGREGAALFLILLTCYGYFIPKAIGDDWVASSRAALVFALVDRHEVTIDAYHDRTGDKAFFAGHYYTVGTIGPSLLGVPAYAAYALLARLPFADRVIARYAPAAAPRYQFETGALAAVTFWTVSVPSALIGLLVFRIGVGLGGAHAFAVALVYGLGTIAFPYSRAFYQHQVAAFCAVAGGALLWRAPVTRRPAIAMAGAGVLFGAAGISEYSSIFIVAPLVVFLWPRLTPRALMVVCAGTLLPGAAAAAYHLAAFNTIWPVSYSYHVSQTVNRSGVMGVGWPSASALFELTLGTFRGLFFLSPVLLLAPYGLVLMWRTQQLKRLGALCASVMALFFLYNASYGYWWGGYSIGPRFLVPALPFMTLPLLFVWQRWWGSVWGRLTLGLFTALSIFNVWTLSITGDYYPSDAIRNPLVEHAVPALLRCDIGRNYGMWLALQGCASLLPLCACVAAILVWSRTVPSAGPRPTGVSAVGD